MSRHADPHGTISTERLADGLKGLEQYTEGATPGWTRRVFSDAYRGSRHHVLELMRSAGLEARVDPGGNIVGRLAGSGGRGAIMTGSHTDTVHAGGRFDGMVGVIAGIEVAHTVREQGIRLKHDLIVVDFLGEEANSFGISCLGSRGMVGTLNAGHLDRRDESGATLGDSMTAFGIDPHEAIQCAWQPGDISAYVELHIEQGPVLEATQVPIGIVTGIAGIERLLVSFNGRADHAGTRPMNDRRDALLAAAEAALLIERTACDAPVHAVATTGRIESEPGSYNIVPDVARLWSEVRSVDRAWLQGARRDLATQIAEQAATRDVTTALEWLSDQDPVQTSSAVQDVVAAAADRAGIAWRALPSGAGHDAAHIADVAPTGMIFIPSRGGRSHVPDEWTDAAEIAMGTRVLLDSLLALDATRP